MRAPHPWLSHPALQGKRSVLDRIFAPLVFLATVAGILGVYVSTAVAFPIGAVTARRSHGIRRGVTPAPVTVNVEPLIARLHPGKNHGSGSEINLNGTTTTDGGLTLTATAGSGGAAGTWYRKDGYIYEASGAALSNLLCDPGLTTLTLEWRIATGIGGAGNLGVAFRWVDASNYWRVVADQNSPGVYIQKCVAGTLSSVGGSPFGSGQTPGDYYRLVITPTSITLYRNSTLLGSSTDTTHAAGTKCGLHSNAAPFKFSTFRILGASASYTYDPAAYDAEVLTDTPAVYWAESRIDKSGNGRDAANAHLPSLGAPIVSNGPPALRFRGRGLDYLSRAYDAVLDVGTGDAAIEVWVQFENDGHNYVQLAGRDDASTGNGMMLYIEGETNLANNPIANGYPRGYAGGSTVEPAASGSGYDLLDGVTYHLVLQRVSGQLQIWLNGTMIVTGAAAGSTNIGAELRFGRVNGAYDDLIGSANRFAYYTHSLSSGRIGAHYTAGLAA